MLPAGANPILYAEDLLGTSRVNTDTAGVVCYDADFYPYGGERAPYTDTCTQNFYKFEGKERDAETGNDDFGARYYSNRFGRWLSADWSNVPAPVPYANLSNPQTLNLYAMVADDPESFADLDGHDNTDVIKLTTIADTVFPEFAPIITGIAAGYLIGQAAWDNRSAIGDAVSGAGGGGGQYGDFSHQQKIPDIHSNENTSDTNASQSNANDKQTNSQPSLSDHKKALKEVQGKVGKLPKGKQGKFGSPQRGDSKKGYRLDPGHPNAVNADEKGKHFNYWDYTGGKRNSGGTSGAVPIPPDKRRDVPFRPPNPNKEY
jgi:RHS repeat-associated protein